MRFTRIALTLVGVPVLLTACATTSRLHTAGVPPGSLRLGQVVLLATRQEILTLPELQDSRRALRASGIEEADLRDGSLALARVYCCGGYSEGGTAIKLYVPRGLDVQLGDVVEVRSGRAPSQGDPGAANVAVQTRQRGTTGLCRWEPPDPRLRLRFLYCSWMPAEGWIEHKEAFGEMWMKPADGQKP
jgi:hypothetical protein